MTIQQEAGTALRSMREGKGLSQAKLSELSGITQSHIHHIETGEGNPTLATLGRLARALGGAVKLEWRD